MKKLLLTAAAGLAVVAAPIAASAQSYGHGYGHDRGGWSGRNHSDRRSDGGALVAAGVFGLLLGAIATSAANSHPAYDYGYGYGPGYNYGPTYNYGYGSAYNYGSDCGWQTQAYRNAWGQVQYQQVEVCR